MLLCKVKAYKVETVDNPVVHGDDIRYTAELIVKAENIMEVPIIVHGILEEKFVIDKIEIIGEVH